MPISESSSPVVPAYPTGQSWTATITSKKPFFNIPIKEIWRYRDLILLSIRRDFVAMHKQTIMGPLWYIIPPLMSTVVMQVVFGRIAKISTNDIPPFLFFLSGVIIWYYFSACLSKTSSTFTSNAGLFTKVYFPRLTIPIAQCIGNLWQFLIQLLIFVGFYIFFLLKGADIHFSYRIIIIPALIVQTALLGLGFGCLISALTTRFRDLQMAVAPGIQLWMYGSCIFFPKSAADDYPFLQMLLTINPVVPIVETFRFAVMGQGQVEIWQWLLSMGITLAVLIIGLIEFGRAEKTMADTI